MPGLTQAMQAQLLAEFFGTDEDGNPLAFVQLHNGPAGDGTFNVGNDTRRMPIILDDTGANIEQLVWNNSPADTLTHFSLWSDPTTGTCIVSAPFGGFVPTACSVSSSGVITANGTHFTNGDAVEAISDLTVALPGVLTPDLQYYVVGASGATFALATTPGGPAISLGATAFTFRCQKCLPTSVRAGTQFKIDVGNLGLRFA